MIIENHIAHIRHIIGRTRSFGKEPEIDKNFSIITRIYYIDIPCHTYSTRRAVRNAIVWVRTSRHQDEIVNRTLRQ